MGPKRGAVRQPPTAAGGAEAASSCRSAPRPARRGIGAARAERSRAEPPHRLSHRRRGGLSEALRRRLQRGLRDGSVQDGRQPKLWHRGGTSRCGREDLLYRFFLASVSVDTEHRKGVCSGGAFVLCAVSFCCEETQ
ncbi:uncharacterized protein FYW23_015297 [Sylvia borin]